MISSYCIHWGASCWYHMKKHPYTFLNDLRFIDFIGCESLRLTTNGSVSIIPFDIFVNSVGLVYSFVPENSVIRIFFTTAGTIIVKTVVYFTHYSSVDSCPYVCSVLCTVCGHVLTYTHTYRFIGCLLFHISLGFLTYNETITCPDTLYRERQLDPTILCMKSIRYLRRMTILSETCLRVIRLFSHVC